MACGTGSALRSARRVGSFGTSHPEPLALHLKKFPADRDDHLFRMERGGQIIRTSFFDHVWHGSVKKAGLPAGTGMHALRHAYASLLIAGGESVKVVSERLGHTNAAMTLNTYSHLFPDSEERTRQAVDAAFQDHADPLRTRKRPANRSGAGQRAFR
ncbi:tyrosine-type recombinase/integrase [Streptomyces sp. DR7-3]|uniref:tyrosine-type recombinase/integrase n=1 Tax=Streptomyces malaysiensis TaxID=92644 RepID=UPI00204487F4|nr:tyrosine-type recombinase/integrase [Streptomyces sp. DR7-3]MCM3806235.1 tyrosine-type recombinase/integrase [Streptomyces sp. DR7-3]